MTIEIDLPADLQQFVADRARADGSRPEEFVVKLLRRIKEKEARAALEAKLLEGVESLERGERKLITPEYGMQ